MDVETVTLELPESLYRTAHQVAEATGQPLQQVLQASIAHALGPLGDVPPVEAAELASLMALDDGALWRAARDTATVAEEAELHDLLDRQGADELTAVEQARLQQLLDDYGRRLVRSAHAYLLLARRGYRVPPQGDTT
jgi:hypothetical protein